VPHNILHLNASEIKLSEKQQVGPVAESMLFFPLVCDALCSCATLTVLDLSNLTDGAMRDVTGIEAVGLAVRQHPSLTMLTLGTERIVTLKTELTEVDLSNALLLRPTALIVAAFLPKCQALTKLNLVQSCAALDATKVMAMVIRDQPSLSEVLLSSEEDNLELGDNPAFLSIGTSMTELDLSSAILGASGAILAAAAFKRCPVLSNVNLLRNKLQKKGAKAVAAAFLNHRALETLCGIKQGQQELDLSGLKLNIGDVIIVAADLKKNKSIRAIDLSNNPLATSAVGEELSGALASNRTLKQLNLSGIKCRGDVTNFAQALCVGLQSNQSILSLDMRCNDIPIESCEALAAALQMVPGSTVVGVARGPSFGRLTRQLPRSIVRSAVEEGGAEAAESDDEERHTQAARNGVKCLRKVLQRLQNLPPVDPAAGTHAAADAAAVATAAAQVAVRIAGRAWRLAYEAAEATAAASRNWSREIGDEKLLTAEEENEQLRAELLEVKKEEILHLQDELGKVRLRATTAEHNSVKAGEELALMVKVLIEEKEMARRAGEENNRLKERLEEAERRVEKAEAVGRRAKERAQQAEQQAARMEEVALEAFTADERAQPQCQQHADKQGEGNGPMYV
jgi:hypothetical protein